MGGLTAPMYSAKMVGLLPFSDRRSDARGDLRLAAFIDVFDAKPLQCQVLDLTLKGARVEADQVALPSEFILALKTQSLLRLKCQVVWRDGFTVGVKFLSASKTLAHRQ